MAQSYQQHHHRGFGMRRLEIEIRRRHGPEDRVETAGLAEAELAEYCRKKGLFVEQVRAWRQVCETAIAEGGADGGPPDRCDEWRADVSGTFAVATRCGGRATDNWGVMRMGGTT